MVDVPDFNTFLKQGAVAPSPSDIPSFDDFLSGKSPKGVIVTPEQGAVKVQQEQGTLPKPEQQQDSSDEGFWSLAGRSLIQSAVTAGQEVVAGAKASVPTALGGSTVQQQAEGLPEPSAQDEITRLNRQPISSGWTNPRWWGVKLGQNLGAVAPAAGLGIAGTAVGGALAGPVGAVGGGAAGAAGGMALQELVPAYKAARARGLDHDSALNEALTQSGIAAGFGAAMGIVGGTPLFGTTINGALRRPITEALTKLGLVEPGLMVGQQQVQKAAGAGGWITPDEAIEGYIMGAGVGATIHAAHTFIPPLTEQITTNKSKLSPEGLLRGYQVTQEAPPDLPSLNNSAPNWPISRDFYRQTAEAIASHPESMMKPEEWHDVMKGAHKSAENITLPFWLADDTGKIPKQDLLAFLEDKGVWVKRDTTSVPGATIMSVYEPRGTTKPFANIGYTIKPDREGQMTFALMDVRLFPDRIGNMKANIGDVLSHTISRYAASEKVDRIAWTAQAADLQSGLLNLASIHGMPRGTTKLDDKSGVNLDYVNLSPVVSSNIRQGGNLFSQKPGTYLNEDPFGAGKKAINGFLDRAAASQIPRSEWVQTPEGGLGLYMRLRREEGNKRLVDIANLDFEKRGSGAFTHYLHHIEQEAQRRGLQGVRVENILNERLIPFLEKRGYVKEQDFGGEPSYRKEIPTETAAMAKPAFPTASPGLLTPKDLAPAGRRVAKIIEELRKSMGMKAPLVINMHEGISPSGSFGEASRTSKGYEINIYLGAHEKSGAEGIFTTAAHEFGHITMWHFFDRSSIDVKNNISKAFDRFRAAMPKGELANDLLVRRNNAVAAHYGEQYFDPDIPVLSMTPERIKYWNGFEEWFAEQTARWATTQEKPLGLVDRFFQSLGRRVLSVVQKVKGTYRPQEFQPEPEMKAWLDSLVKDVAPFAADIYAAAQLRSLRQNQKAFDSAGESIDAVPQTASTGGSRGLIRRIFGGNGPNPEIAAGADRFNKFYDYMISMPQLAKLNPHIDGLQRYRELVSMLHLEKVQMMNEAETTLHFWRSLQPRQADAVAGLIDDYMNMTYRTPDEIKKKVSRRPTEDEFKTLATKHGVSDKGMDVFRRVVQDFARMLDRYRLLLEQGAHEIADPVVSAQKLEDIAKQIAQLRKAPYFPAMRFGNYTLTVRDSANKVVHFETFESSKKQQAAHEAALKEFPPDHNVRSGYLKKDVAPLVGMPPGLLDKIGEKLELSRSQKDALDELRYEYMPAQSFAHRFRQKKDVPGYSSDFLRAYAYYMFHGSNYFTRAKYVDFLREAVKDTREESLTLEQATKRDQIANFMSDHLKFILDPKSDFAALRSMMFHWALGFSPAAATLNLSQSMLGTYPYLSSKFGSDLRAVAAMARASKRLSTFYTKINLEGATDPELKGLAEATRQGLISETQANVLAATADGRVLSQGFGGNRVEKAFNLFSRASQFFFEMTEQTNRRVAFRAAWDMAMADPGNGHVRNMVRENKLLYESLRLKGFTDQEAGAYVTAKDAVESTQYVYAPYARPKFMRGGFKSTLFVFHSFTQNTLFYLWNNPGAAMRSLVLLAGAGGLMGLPGMEDANGLIRALAYHLFGKDFDLQDSVRQFVVDVLHGGGKVDRPGSLTGEAGIRPDILLHGMSRVGYGIPALMDQLGAIAGMGHIPMPVVDRHANLSMGSILGIEPGQLLAPQITGPGAGVQNVDSSALRQTQRAAGAAFGLGFALYRALESTQSPTDFRRWEGIMPTAMRNASQAFRYYNEGKARNAQGASIVRFDPNEPEQMMEIIGQALGYRPERLSAQWDRKTAEREAEAFWDVRRQYLMQSAWSAKQSGDKEVYSSAISAIKKFNGDLPIEARAKAITSDALRESFQTKARATAATESGVPRQKANVPLARSVQRLYPEANPAAGKKYPPQGGALGR